MITFRKVWFLILAATLIQMAEVAISIANDINVVISAGQTWMDRNLGARRVALAPDDEASYGGYFQWGRDNDGHAWPLSSNTSTLSSTDTPNHDMFITSGPAFNYDWRSPQSNLLWQGANGINNPCPGGFRIPTETEWQTELNTWNPLNDMGAFLSPLKLPAAGYRSHSSGAIGGQGTGGYYWTSTVNTTYVQSVTIVSFTAYILQNLRAEGLNVRCIQD